MIAAGTQAEGVGANAELGGGDHQIAVRSEGGIGGDLIFLRGASVIAEPPPAEGDGGGAGVVEFDPILLTGGGIGEDLVDGDRSDEPVWALG